MVNGINNPLKAWYYERIFLLLSDFFGVILGLYLARYLRAGRTDFSFLLHWELLGFLLTIYFIFYLFDLYTTNNDFFGLSNFLRSILAILVSIPAISFYILILPLDSKAIFWRSILFIFFPILCLWSCLFRSLAYKFFHLKRLPSKWMVITNAHSNSKLLDNVSDRYKMEFVFVKEEEFSNYLGHQDWSGIIMDDEITLKRDLLEKIVESKLSSKLICTISDFYELFFFKVPLFSLKKRWFFLFGNPQILRSKFSLRIKRIIDITLSIFFLLCFLPFLIIIAILIKVDSKGPIFYVQKRRGVHDKIFTIFKFRSMAINVKESKALGTTKNDPRITRVGRFLRLMRLDEVPQLINVIKGDMSFIGPRPCETKLVEIYAKQIPFYNMRHCVRPGLTGWAQVLYSYGSSIDGAREKLQYDLYYIKHFSFYLDLVILLKTCRTVFFSKGR